jgi:protein-tyrosine phosphatase
VLPSRARQITPDDLSRFDHVLTMDRQNLRAVNALSRPGTATATIGPITAHCRRFDVEEVPDPYYGGEEGFDQVLDLLEDACTGLLETLQAGGI